MIAKSKQDARAYGLLMPYDGPPHVRSRDSQVLAWLLFMGGAVAFFFVIVPALAR